MRRGGEKGSAGALLIGRRPTWACVPGLEGRRDPRRDVRASVARAGSGGRGRPWRVGPSWQREGRDAVASERLSASRGLRRWRVGLRRGEGEGDAVRGAGRCASACWAARRCGSGRGAGWSARAREREKREERVGPASWAVGLVTRPRWFGVWAPFLIPFLFYFFSFLNLILIQTKFEFKYKIK